MSNLDNLDFMKKLDRENILQNMQDLPNQIEKCWADWQKIALPTHFINAKNILILGVGGSGMSGSLFTSIFEKEVKIPMAVCRDYHIPRWVDKNTLVVAISYSGNTEETISTFRQAAAQTDKLITISSGGELASLSSQQRAVHYKIEYGSQPRQAIGFSFISIVALMAKLRLIELSNEKIQEAIILLKGFLKKIDIDVTTGQNMAKLLARRIFDKIPVVLGSGILSEVARRWKQSFNENSKTASYFEIIPEMNHNAMVGTEFPKNLGGKIFVIILSSQYDQQRNKLRQNITSQILNQRRIENESVMIQPAGAPISETLQMILLGDFVSYYLAVLNNVAPDPVKIIDFLKDKLAEEK